MEVAGSCLLHPATRNATGKKRDVPRPGHIKWRPATRERRLLHPRWQAPHACQNRAGVAWVVPQIRFSQCFLERVVVIPSRGSPCRLSIGQIRWVALTRAKCRQPVQPDVRAGLNMSPKSIRNTSCRTCISVAARTGSLGSQIPRLIFGQGTNFDRNPTCAQRNLS